MARLMKVPPLLVSHTAHPAHELKLMASTPFRCDGCKQHGDERRYRCIPCNYDLHICCAPLRESTDAPELVHPLFHGITFSFFHEPPACPSGTRRHCDICGDRMLGFVYHNCVRNLDVHPCCACLPQRIVQDGLAFDLHTEAEASRICGLCGQSGRRSSFWSYGSRDDDGELVYLHVGCMKDGSGSGGQIVQGSVPARRISSQIVHGKNVPAEQGMQLQNVPARRRTRWFRRACKLTKILAKITYALLTGDPASIFMMVADVNALLTN